MGKNLFVITFCRDCSSYYFHNLERARAFTLEAYEDECCEDENYDRLGAEMELKMYNTISDYAWIECCQYSDKED